NCAQARLPWFSRLEDIGLVSPRRPRLRGGGTRSGRGAAHDHAPLCGPDLHRSVDHDAAADPDSRHSGRPASVRHSADAAADARGAGVRVRLRPPAGPRETIRQSSAAFVSEVHAQAGINGHFFLPFPSTDTSAWLIGLAAFEGPVVSAFD